MWQVFLFLLVTPKSEQADVAVLLGSDSQEVYIYTKHLEDMGHLTCLGDDVSIEDYPGDFSGGKVGAVYLDNIGVFVCGGFLQQEQPSNTGCNRLTVEESEGIHNSWNPIEYVDVNEAFTGVLYGKALVAKEFVPEGNQGFWITGGDVLDWRTWTYDWEYDVDESIQQATAKEPYVRNGHCLVRLKTHNHQHFQYLEIGGRIRGNEETIIESYHCYDDDCTEWTWSIHELSFDPDLTHLTCTVYTPPDSTDDVVLVVSGGHTFRIKCETWLQESISCIWEIEELVDSSQISVDPYPDTDRASMVNLDGVPHIFGVDGKRISMSKDKQVFKFMENRWEELHIMKDPKENLVTVSVPEEYICNGTQPTTSAPATTAGRTLSTLIEATTTEHSLSPDPDPCDNTGTCKRADNREVEWEGEYGEKVVKTCSEAGVEGEGNITAISVISTQFLQFLLWREY